MKLLSLSLFHITRLVPLAPEVQDHLSCPLPVLPSIHSTCFSYFSLSHFYQFTITRSFFPLRSVRFKDLYPRPTSPPVHSLASPSPSLSVPSDSASSSLVKTLTISPLSSDPSIFQFPSISAMDFLIAIRKGNHFCTNAHPLCNFFTYSNLSLTYSAFISSISSVSITNSVL